MSPPPHSAQYLLPVYGFTKKETFISFPGNKTIAANTRVEINAKLPYATSPAHESNSVFWNYGFAFITPKVWLCGGRLLHVPCSRIGHVPREQPYFFPVGRRQTEEFNYKRAIIVWMGNYSRFIYNWFPDMKTIDMGDISSRLELKSKLKCKKFGWYLQNVWPELNVLDEKVIVWGMVVNEAHPLCLDNNYHLFQETEALYLSPCTNELSSQAFSLTTDNLLRTSLQCVKAPNASEGAEVKIQDCIIWVPDKWVYNQDHSIVHQKSNLCLEAVKEKPQLNKCQASSKSQKWTFKPIHLEII